MKLNLHGLAPEDVEALTHPFISFTLFLAFADHLVHSSIEGKRWAEGILEMSCKICKQELIKDDQKTSAIHSYKSTKDGETNVLESVCDECHCALSHRIKFDEEVVRP